jgi:hypothetical protein
MWTPASPSQLFLKTTSERRNRKTPSTIGVGSFSW